MSQPEVRILYINIDPEKISPATLEGWLAAFPALKREQIRKHRHHANQVQSTLGWQLVERGMRQAGFTDFSLDAVHFDVAHKSFADLPADFNISHSGSLVCAGVVRDGRIGIDVEKIRPLKTDVIHKYLTPDQANQCESEPERFFDFWTQKEAVVKANGEEGIVRIREVRLRNGLAEFANKQWYVTPLTLVEGYAAHIATDLPFDRVHIEQVNPLA